MSPNWLLKSVTRFSNKHIHFLQIHYIYIALIIFIFSGLYYAQPGTSWAYIDSLYMATTGCTNTGINTIVVSSMSTYQVAVLYFSSFFGSHIVVSFVVVMVRKHYFSKRFKEVVLFNKARKIRELNHRRQNSKPHIRVLLPSDIVRTSSMQPNKNESPSSTHSVSNIGNATPTDTSGDIIIGAYPLTMPLQQQHEKHIQQLRRDSQESMEHTTQGIVDSFHRQQQQQQQQQEQQEDIENVFYPTSSVKSSQPLDSDSETDDMNKEDVAHGKSHFDHNPTLVTAANGGANIIFADNILQQREAARQRLQAQRKLEEGRHSFTTTGTMDDYQQRRDNSYEQESRDAADVLSLAIDQVELTREQRYLVGGAEYRALDLLTIVIPLYYLGILIGASLIFRLYIAVSPYAQKVLLTTNNSGIPVNPWYLSFFICLSAMNNLGLSQIDASMVPFQNSPFPLLLCGFLILAGNTAYPIFLRFTLWCMYHVTPRSYSMHRETLRYLLDHPRRCYTTLFPSRQTWWLLGILIAINLTEIVVYVCTNYWLPVMDGIPVASQILDALFQGIATRNAGFSVVNLAMLNPGTILVYIVAMYIGVYPVAISMRNSNVYQERSLGMYRTENEPQDDDDDHSEDNGGVILKLRTQKTINSVMTTSKKIFHRPDFFVMTQIQRQLTKDICWVIIGIFCVCVLEAQSIMSPSPVTIGSVMFECVSAFGCVGGSLGGTVPGTSQSADYRTVSKLVLILLMYRGRHRGLPAAIDRAVLLPSEQLERSDTEEQQLHRLYRSPSCTTTATPFNHSRYPNIKVYQRSETL